MLDFVGLLAIQVLFVVAASTPVVLVLLYRGSRVTARRAEICAIMDVAFGKKVAVNAPPPATAGERERRRARRALDNNPYISDLAETFDVCHSWRQYTFPGSQPCHPHDRDLPGSVCLGPHADVAGVARRPSRAPAPADYHGPGRRLRVDALSGRHPGAQ